MAVQIGVAQREVAGLDLGAPWAQGQKQGAIEKDLLGIRPSHPVPQPVLVRVSIVPLKPGYMVKELGNQAHMSSICMRYTLVKASIRPIGHLPVATKYAELQLGRPA
jgi:hypothetical protein